MGLLVAEFWVPKKGNSREDYEDAFACDVSKGRFAVADGATESSFAAAWARGLVEGFAAQPPDLAASPGKSLEAWLQPLQESWRSSISWESLPWFAEEKARAGAFASLLGFTIEAGSAEPDSPSIWRAIAVGDSCLFHVGADALLAAFPIAHSREFGNRPVLLSSNASNNRPVWDEIRRLQGACNPGDYFLLTTDALGHWFLRETESGGKPWKRLESMSTSEEFGSWCSAARENGLLRNDDTTLVRIEATG